EQWWGGFHAEVKIDEDSKDWYLKFEYPCEIYKIWDATVFSRNGNKYLIKGPGEPKSGFGFLAKGCMGWEKPAGIRFFPPDQAGDGNLPIFNNAPSGSVVALNGWLKIVNNRLSNQRGEPIQLRGVSTHGLQWWQGRFANHEVVKWVKNDWNVKVFRAAMYTREGGYIDDRGVKYKVEEVIKAAIAEGVYVIVDWHILSDYNPLWHVGEAKEFFRDISSRYGKNPNIIYEICNEPNKDAGWNNAIRPYAEQVIPVIRQNDPNNIIVVGTPNWSSNLYEPADNPLKGPGFHNIMYSFHLYAGSHDTANLDWIQNVIDRGIPVFVTEWGVSKADGSNGIYLESSKRFLDFLDGKKISWVSWSLSDSDESSALLNPGAHTYGWWRGYNLTEAGHFIKSRLWKK
ncbi:MAG: glycoside hydrolase family 5 protein, partial [Oligoflexales bacterium]|nr:glycoside hydrolase family 5 protein [Oligoflexales bacterium]